MQIDFVLAQPGTYSSPAEYEPSCSVSDSHRNVIGCDTQNCGNFVCLTCGPQCTKCGNAYCAECAADILEDGRCGWCAE
jgi:hypothetical protein